MNRPTLKFVTGGPREGFRTAGLSIYNDIDPDTLLRELLQNSLDAARKIKRGCTQIRFILETMPTQEIPSYKDYQEHFEASCKTQKKLDTFEQAAGIAERIKKALNSKETSVLWIMDNGVGLDECNANSLLGDGQSVKSDASDTGSYGNGHVTVFPASNLRYLLYGGVYQSNNKTKRIVTGHTMLATHQLNEITYGKDGFLVNKILQDDLISPFVYYHEGCHSNHLDQKLDWIEEHYGSGTCVGILGFNKFNRFDDEEDIVDSIERVAASHFQPAIYWGDMNVTIETSDTHRQVDKTALERILEKEKDRKRRRQGSIGPTGKQTWEVLKTLKNPTNRYEFETSAGVVSVYLRSYMESNSGSMQKGVTTVQLFRNNMWISNDLPKNRPSDFAKSDPFCAVILLDPDNASHACDLIRKAEGPRHIDVKLPRLDKKSPEFIGLDNFLAELHRKISELAPAQKSEEYSPGFLTLDVLSNNARFEGKRQKSRSGQPIVVPKNRPHYKRGQKPNGGRIQINPFHRFGERLKAAVTYVRKSEGLRVRILPHENASSAVLRLVVANGSDETCDRPDSDQYVEITKDATVDGTPVSDSEYRNDREGRTIGLVLSSVKNNHGELDIWLPLPTMPDYKVNIELLKRVDTKKPSTKFNND